MPEISTDQHPVILFDGVCNLCTGVVQFIIKHDKKGVFKFASLQSQFGALVLEKFKLPTTEFSSFVLLYKGKVFIKSTGALTVAKHLSGLWPVFYILIIVPAFIRNSVYRLVAKNRYKWFGKKEECWLPTPELKKNFYD